MESIASARHSTVWFERSGLMPDFLQDLDEILRAHVDILNAPDPMKFFFRRKLQEGEAQSLYHEHGPRLGQ